MLLKSEWYFVLSGRFKKISFSRNKLITTDMVSLALRIFLIILVFWKQSHALVNIPQPLMFPIRAADQRDDCVKCDLPIELVNEIKSYEGISKEIMEHFLDGSFKGKSYRRLEELVDKFGPRFSGTKNLENSIDFMLNRMKNQMGLQNVHGENVVLPQWVRGYERGELISPRRKEVSVLGLGWSVGTPQGGLEAELIVVKDFAELQNRSSEVRGKIVVFNNRFITYATTSPYRINGASEAAKLGAIASLTRSVGPLSLYTPHTGMVIYQTNVTKIPAACITLEDADLFQRLQDKGEKIVLRLVLNDYLLQPVISRNVMGEIPGRENSNEVVIVSGHLDSWDVGEGAVDDGGGVVITLEAMDLLNSLNLKPRRTLKAILWTGEEMGLLGAKEYAKEHLNELQDISAVMESDAATFKPLGLGFAGSDEGGCIIKEISKLLAPLNATSFQTFTKVSSDSDVFTPYNIPGITLTTEATKRYWYHHTEADTLTAQDSGELDLCAAVWAVTAFVLADMSIPLPRDTLIS